MHVFGLSSLCHHELKKSLHFTNSPICAIQWKQQNGDTCPRRLLSQTCTKKLEKPATPQGSWYMMGKALCFCILDGAWVLCIWTYNSGISFLGGGGGGGGVKYKQQVLKDGGRGVPQVELEKASWHVKSHHISNDWFSTCGPPASPENVSELGTWHPRSATSEILRLESTGMISDSSLCHLYYISDVRVTVLQWCRRSPRSREPEVRQVLLRKYPGIWKDAWYFRACTALAENLG
jgi:hypothetical protein